MTFRKIADVVYHYSDATGGDSTASSMVFMASPLIGVTASAKSRACTAAHTLWCPARATPQPRGERAGSSTEIVAVCSTTNLF